VQVREDGAEIDQIVISPVIRDQPARSGQQRYDGCPEAHAGARHPGIPGSANPPSGTTGVSPTATLSWNAVGAMRYDVSFGSANPPPQVSSGQTAASYSPAMTAGTTYYWQIVARNSAGSTAGPVWSFSTMPAVVTHTEIVIYASDIPATALHGSWATVSDATSPNGVKLATPDAGWASTNNPLASPADYVDVTFTADANRTYAVWWRLKASGNSKYNDSMWVQFSDVFAGGFPIYPLNSTSGLNVNLATDAGATSLNNWGWQNGAYWLTQPVTVTFPTTGPHTMRIQVREDGVQFDQIVLSSSRYLTTAPGPVTNDSTIAETVRAHLASRAALQGCFLIAWISNPDWRSLGLGSTLLPTDKPGGQMNQRARIACFASAVMAFSVGTASAQLTLQIKDYLTMPMTGLVDGKVGNSVAVQSQFHQRGASGSDRLFIRTRTGRCISSTRTKKLTTHLDFNGREPGPGCSTD
jgi:hypothetical protein